MTFRWPSLGSFRACWASLFPASRVIKGERVANRKFSGIAISRLNAHSSGDERGKIGQKSFQSLLVSCGGLCVAEEELQGTE